MSIKKKKKKYDKTFKVLQIYRNKGKAITLSGNQRLIEI